MHRNTETTVAKPSLLLSTDDIVKIESRNALRQFDAGIKLIEESRGAGSPFVLRVSHICDLNRIAIEGIHSGAGTIRTTEVRIGNSQHSPPEFASVQGHLEEMCSYVNKNTNEICTPLHIAAFVLWKLNWIHPFVDGNGRTSRMLSYVILCIRLGFVLPGKTTIPEQIVSKKPKYYSALESADASWKKGKVDVRILQDMLEEMLKVQLSNIHTQATGGNET